MGRDHSGSVVVLKAKLTLDVLLKFREQYCYAERNVKKVTLEVFVYLFEYSIIVN